MKKYRNRIHLKSGKELLHIGENLVRAFQYSNLKEITYTLDDDTIISGSAIEYIKSEEVKTD